MRYAYQPRRKLSAEETAANAVAREARSKAAMHCQICARDILSNAGRVAHHGYTRPGHGWQTSSCFGAKRLPFEADRAALGEFITSLKDWHVRMVADRAEVATEVKPVGFDLSPYNRLTGRHEIKIIHVTRATFDAIKIEHEGMFRSRSIHSFDEILERDLRERDAAIKNIAHDIVEFESRFVGWKKTHSWIEGRGWQPVVASYPYPWCRDKVGCAGRGSCPRDPNCGE